MANPNPNPKPNPHSNPNPNQEFGSDGRGGRLSYELTVAPSACSWNPAADGQACEWNSLDTVYATLLTEYQWLNLTQVLP